MKKISLLLSMAILCNCSISTAQTNEEAAVKLPIQQFFEGMNKSDSSVVKASLLQGGRLEAIVMNASNETTVKSESFDGFLKSISKATAGDLDERLSSVEIRVDANMATAWTPYKFYYKGNFSHCGVNTFRLVKTTTGWKIWSIMDTRRKDKCE